MKNIRVAQRYASAFLQVAQQDKTVDSVARDLALIGETLRGSRELRLLVRSPVVSGPKKVAVFRVLFGTRVGKDTLAFVELLIEKHRETLLPEVIAEYKSLCDALLGIITVGVTSAVAVDREQQARLQSELERYTGKKVRLQLQLDASVKGGLVIRIGDTVRDASLKRQLDLLKERFVSGGPLSN
jgi:F-type H+-transporting ATPase subunit delta